ncbi:hypothetical protein F5X99DRAFT_395026 [Biscogniauxia marginata]|nr:hypothetical protein F5X99DRAFT_395026 [Biscogniauxia marginata]
MTRSPSAARPSTRNRKRANEPSTDRSCGRRADRGWDPAKGGGRGLLPRTQYGAAGDAKCAASASQSRASRAAM